MVYKNQTLVHFALTYIDNVIGRIHILIHNEPFAGKVSWYANCQSDLLVNYAVAIAKF